MKLFLAVLFSFSFLAIANENASHGEKHDGKHEDKKVKTQSAEAYLKAKKECLAENEEFKGKALKDCIVKKQTEAK